MGALELHQLVLRVPLDGLNTLMVRMELFEADSFSYSCDEAGTVQSTEPRR